MVLASGIGLLTVAGAGFVSFLSPCVLPLVPGYLSFIAGRSVIDPELSHDARFRFTIVILAVAFVLGFSTVFVIMGASATALGQPTHAPVPIHRGNGHGTLGRWSG